MLFNGNWARDWDPVQAQDNRGRFLRQTSGFRHWITADGSSGPDGQHGYTAEAGRYHLYVAYICPWASRALMARALKGLTDVISISVVEPWLNKQGWAFGTGINGAMEDPLHSYEYVHQLYTQADAGYSGRATVPVLWDKKTETIVNNESADIIRMLDSAFSAIAPSETVLYPQEFAREIDILNDELYHGLNNGVYRAGFATTQQAYSEAVTGVFQTLDTLEDRLRRSGPYLFGEMLVETDIRLFVSLIRFDAAYHGLFKCNLRSLIDYPALSKYVIDVLGVPGIRETVNLEHIKEGYYSIKALNPLGIVPSGPESIASILREQPLPRLSNGQAGIERSSTSGHSMSCST